MSSTGRKKNQPKRCRLSGPLEDVRLLICRFLPDGTLTYANGNYCRHYKRKQRELIGQNYFAMVPEKDRGKLRQQIRSITSRNSAKVYDCKAVVPGGSVRWNRWIIRAVYDGGKLTGYESAGHDITALKQTHERLESKAAERARSLNLTHLLRAEVEDRRRVTEALQKSEQRYRAIIEDQSEYIVRYLPGGTLTFVNQASCKFLNKPYDELIGENILSFIPTKDQNTVKRKIISITGNHPVSATFRVFAPDGSVRWHHWTGRAIRGSKGKIIEYQAVGHDITALKKAEEALRQSEEKYRYIVDNVSDGIYQMNRSGYFTYMNNVAIKRSGLSPDNYKKVRFTDLVIPEERKRIKTYLWRALRGTVQIFEVLNLHSPDGHPCVLEIMGSPIFENGRVTGVQGITRDITKRKAYEAALEQSRNMLLVLLNTIPEPTLLITKDLVVEIANTTAAGYLGARNSNRIKGCSLSETFEKKYGEELAREIADAIREGRQLNREVKLSTDPVKYKRLSVYPINNESPGTAVIRVRDITEEKWMYQETLRHEKLETLRLLVSGITHEISNPNNFITFNIPILRDYLQAILPLLDAQVHSSKQDFRFFDMPYNDFKRDLFVMIDNMEQGALRIHGSIDQLKDLAGENGNDQRRLQRLRLADIVERAVSSCLPQIKKNINTLIINSRKNHQFVWTDARTVEQVIVNFLLNAVHAADKEDSLIRIELKRRKVHGRQHIVEVSDNGSGMDEETLSKIFEPFFTTKTYGMGKGIGLYVSKKQIEQIGGSIEVESRPGAGTVFRVVLPDHGNRKPDTSRTGTGVA